MAVPKKRCSVSRKGRRRGGQHHRLTPRGSIKCPQCESVALPHRVCPGCGHYRGQAILAMPKRGEEEEEEIEKEIEEKIE